LKKLLIALICSLSISCVFADENKLDPDATMKQCMQQGGDTNTSICQQARQEGNEALSRAIASEKAQRN
jgi:hypothetical protein